MTTCDVGSEKAKNEEPEELGKSEKEKVEKKEDKNKREEHEKEDQNEIKDENQNKIKDESQNKIKKQTKKDKDDRKREKMREADGSHGRNMMRVEEERSSRRKQTKIWNTYAPRDRKSDCEGRRKLWENSKSKKGGSYGVGRPSPAQPQWKAKIMTGKRIANEPDGDRPSRKIHISDLLMLAAEVQTENEDGEEALAGIESDEGRIPIPGTYQEAVNDPIFGSRWKEAIHRELQSLMKFGIWEVVWRDDIGGRVTGT